MPWGEGGTAQTRQPAPPHGTRNYFQQLAAADLSPEEVTLGQLSGGGWPSRDVLAAEHWRVSTGDHLLVGAQVGGGRSPARFHGRENLLCPRLTGKQTVSPQQPSALCPRPAGPPASFPGLAVNSCLLRGTPAPLRHPALPRQPDRRVWGCSAPSLGSRDSEGQGGWAGAGGPRVP